MEKEECALTENRGYSLVAAGLACVTGGLLGAGMALLLAPQSGRQSQERVRGYARRAEGRVHGLADKATEGVEQVWRKGRELINDKQAIVTEAVKVARAALHRERERVAGEQKA